MADKKLRFRGLTALAEPGVREFCSRAIKGKQKLQGTSGNEPYREQAVVAPQTTGIFKEPCDFSEWPSSQAPSCMALGKSKTLLFFLQVKRKNS